MSNLAQRLLLFFLGIPSVVCLIIFLPQFDHAAAVAVVVAFCVGCSLELARLFEAQGVRAKAAPFAILGAGIPACAYAGGSVFRNSASLGFLGGALAGACLGATLCLLAFFVSFAFAKNARMHEVLPRASALAFAAAYPGLLGVAIVLVAAEPRYATESLLAFCILAFSDDSLAWLVGITMGRRRGLVDASPNKSLEGFIGGMCGAVGTACACKLLFPYAMAGPWWEALALGIAVGAAAIVGDLFESAIKRSASIKDSGRAVPGRGGFLDTFDSLLFSAPVFYGLSLIMGFFR
jgi:phosphatidate cytidylyltransferase